MRVPGGARTRLKGNERATDTGRRAALKRLINSYRTEYLGEDDVLWCDPFDTASIAAAMTHSLDVARRRKLIARGLEIAARHDWNDTARAHLATYEKLREPVDA